MDSDKLFIGRQPILDIEEKLYGYELLFRSADTGSANITDSFSASVSVVLNALSSFGIQGLLGKHKGFVNVSQDLLMSEMLELLPCNHVVIEVLENVEVTRAVIERCRILKGCGFPLALDDHRYHEKYLPLYSLVDVVKIDILSMPMSDVQGMVEKFRGMPVRLLAEKVETPEQFARCRKMGFELFQGYYFAKPVVLRQRRTDLGKLTLMKLLQQINRDDETAEIERTFRENPTLTYNLLRLVNSVAMGLREKIKSLRHAIAVLGRNQLKRWVVLALFASNDERGFCNPLVEMAAMRGRLMELLVQGKAARGGDQADTAFMTGVLSFIDIVLEIPMAEATRQLNLADDVRNALLRRDGHLGDLLALTEKLEKTDFGALPSLLAKCRLSRQELHAAHMEAIRWTNSLGELQKSGPDAAGRSDQPTASP